MARKSELWHNKAVLVKSQIGANAAYLQDPRIALGSLQLCTYVFASVGGNVAFQVR